jgi:lathosterol oxidase
MSRFLTVYALMLAFDGGRYVIAVGGALAIFWWWGREKFRHRLIRSNYAPVASMRRELAYSVSTAMIFSANGVALYFGTRAGIFHVAPGLGDRGWLYFLLTLVLLPVMHDTYFYWTHRAMHHRRLFKIVHRVHHLSNNPSPCAAYAFHPTEAVVQAAYVPLITLVMPVCDVSLFLFLAFMISRNVLGHLGLELFPKRFVRGRWTKFSTTTTHHGMHHQRFNGNYGLYFTFWDRVMRTMHEDYEMEFERIASRSPIGPKTRQIGSTVKREIDAHRNSDDRSDDPNDCASATRA